MIDTKSKISRIVSVLKEFVKTPPASPADITFFLVMIRNLLDLTGDKVTFKALNLYCCWVLHWRLQSDDVQVWLGLFDELEVKINDNPTLPIETFVTPDIIKIGRTRSS